MSFAILSPATAQAPPAAAPPAAASSDPFGEEVTLVEKPIIYIAGSGMWDSAFDTITGSFKTVNAAIAKAGIKANGPLMTIYTSTDDTGFQFQAAVPVETAPTLAADSGVTVGMSPAGKALKFVHRGSYDAMDFDLRGDHQLPRREAARGEGPLHRAVHEGSADDAGRRSRHRGLCPAQVISPLT